jgi:hypothetical protein
MAAAGPLTAEDINWRWCAAGAQVMPTRLIHQPPFGTVWISALEPCLDARWLREAGVISHTISTPTTATTAAIAASVATAALPRVYLILAGHCHYCGHSMQDDCRWSCLCRSRYRHTHRCHYVAAALVLLLLLLLPVLPLLPPLLLMMMIMTQLLLSLSR